jgi:hypothetical protein
LAANIISGKSAGHPVVLNDKHASITGEGSAVLTSMGYGNRHMSAGDGRHSLSVLPSKALTKNPGFVHTQALLALFGWLLGTLEQFNSACAVEVKTGRQAEAAST